MKKIGTLALMVALFTGTSFAEPKKVPPGQVKKAVRYGGYTLVERAFQLNGGIGVSLIEPAGFVAADLYPEVYIVKGLSLGFNFVAIPVMEHDLWFLAIDFVNVKYTWIPDTLPRLQPYMRMGYGIGIGGNGDTEVVFDWVWGSGITYWFTDEIGAGTDFVSHVTSDGTIFTWIYGVRWKMGF